MKKKNTLKIIVIIFILILSFFLFSKIFVSPKKIVDIKKIEDLEKKNIQSNTIKDVKYNAIDLSGNEYSLYAREGEIDISDKDIILLKDIESTIKLSDFSIIKIKSDYGKYNIINHDTIFNKNVFHNIRFIFIIFIQIFFLLIYYNMVNNNQLNVHLFRKIIQDIFHYINNIILYYL